MPKRDIHVTSPKVGGRQNAKGPPAGGRFNTQSEAQARRSHERHSRRDTRTVMPWCGRKDSQ